MRYRQQPLMLMLTMVLPVSTAQADINVGFSIMPDNPRHAISPMIYGSDHDLVVGENLGLYRLGGHRSTGYNWENNTSNADGDWNHSSDNFMTWYYGINGTEETESHARSVLSVDQAKQIEATKRIHGIVKTQTHWFW